MNCAKCNNKLCNKSNKNCVDINKCNEIIKLYNEKDNLKITKVSSTIEGKYYCEKNRLEEIIEFCKLMDYKKIGISFCIGLEKEAEILYNILSKYFKVYSVCCKIGGIKKDYLNLQKINKNKNNNEVMCNPIIQAKILNEKNTDLNIIVGLCLGHDILFQKYSNSPTTVFIVKDRVLAHNTVNSLYCSYYLEKHR